MTEVRNKKFSKSFVMFYPVVFSILGKAWFWV